MTACGLDAACAHAGTGQPAAAGLPGPGLRRFPPLVYRVEATEVVVIAVAHQRRAAGYWVGRG